MKTVDYTIDILDLKILFLHSKHVYKGYTFEQWVNEIKEVYSNYVQKRDTPLSFTSWVNGQIIALT